MQSPIKLGILISLYCSFSCKYQHQKEIYVNHLRVVGNIGSDSLYNGNIKFYDSTSGKLVEEATYKDGQLNGRRVIYLPTGKPSVVSQYENGKQNGYADYFDSVGQLTTRDYFYYNVRVGPSIIFNSGHPFIYDFYAFDNNLIYSLNYDSLASNLIVNLQKSFFHLVPYDTVNYFNDGNASNYRLFLLYLINPPKYDFKYDIVLTDSTYKIIKILDDLQNTSPFSFFRIPISSEKNYFYAVRLRVVDSSNKKNDYLMFKKIK